MSLFACNTHITALVTLGAIRRPAIIDTGATNSFVSEKLARELKAVSRMNCYNKRVKLADGSALLTSQAIIIDVGLGTETYEQRLIVLPDMNDDLILGLDFLRRSNAVIQFGGETLTLHAEDQILYSRRNGICDPMNFGRHTEEKERFFNRASLLDVYDYGHTGDLQLGHLRAFEPQQHELNIIEKIVETVCGSNNISDVERLREAKQRLKNQICNELEKAVIQEKCPPAPTMNGYQLAGQKTDVKNDNTVLQDECPPPAPSMKIERFDYKTNSNITTDKCLAVLKSNASQDQQNFNTSSNSIMQPKAFKRKRRNKNHIQNSQQPRNHFQIQPLNNITSYNKQNNPLQLNLKSSLINRIINLTGQSKLPIELVKDICAIISNGFTLKRRLRLKRKYSDQYFNIRINCNGYALITERRKYSQYTYVQNVNKH